MGKQKPKGWLDKFDSTVVKSDATSRPTPGPVFLGNPYAKEMAKRQTYISPYDAKQKASPAMQQVFAEKADAQAKKKRIRNFLEEQQDVLGKAEMLSLIPTPFTEVVGGAAGLTNAAISAALAGQDFSEGNYASALGNFGAGALGVGAGSIGMRGGLNNVIDDLLPTKGPKNFMTGKPMSSTPGTLGTLKPLEPHQEIGFHAIGDFDYVSDRELKEAYEEALDKFQLTNYRPNVDPFLDHDVEKALALNVRMKFADRLPKFTNNNYTAAVHAEDPLFFDGRGPYSERFFNQQGYDLSKLDPQEKALMSAYQHGYDAYFNKRPSVHKLPTTLKDYFGELSDQFNTAVQKNKINKDITLNRSVGDYVLDYWDPVANKSLGRGLRSELQVGDVYKDAGFMSTSLPHYDYGIGRFKDKIIVPGGGVQSYAFPNATSYGQFMGEQEVILPKGLIRRVEDVPEPGNIITSIVNPYENGGQLDKFQNGGLTDKYLGVKTKSKGKYVSPTNGGWTVSPKVAAYNKAAKQAPTDIDANAMQALEQVTSYPQRKVTELITGKNQYPSQALGIQNPVGAFAVDFALDPLNVFGLPAAVKTVGKLGKGAKNIAKTTKAIAKGEDAAKVVSSANNVKNLEDLKHATQFAEQYGYKLPENLERISQSDELTNRTIRGMMDRHNTFVRGVSTNWDVIGKKNPEILKHLEQQGIDWKNNPKAAAEYMSTHVPIQTGYGRASLNNNVFFEGLDALYTSNSVPTAEGYTYGQGFINKVKKPTDYSSLNRQDWITQNNPQYYNDYLPSNNIIKVNGKDVHVHDLNTGGLYSITDYKNVDSFKSKVLEDLEKTANRLKEDYTRSIESNPGFSKTMKKSYDKVVKQIESIKNQKWENTNSSFDKKLLKTESISDVPVKDLMHDLAITPENIPGLAEDDITRKAIFNKYKELNEKYPSWKPGEEGKLNKEKFNAEFYDFAKGIDNPIVQDLIKLHESRKGYAHYLHLGNPGEQVLQPIKSWEITPEKWVNKSRAHINIPTDKLSRAAVAPLGVAASESVEQKKNGGWLDKYQDGGPVQENYNDYSVSAPKGFVGEGFSNVGRNYSPAWGGQFAMGGSLPGAVGFTYARTINPAPSNGPYAKKTKASAQNGIDIPEGEDISYTSENPAFDAASLSIRQGLINSIPELSSPAIDININQRNLGAEHTFTHQPGSSVFSDEPSESYMLKRTVSPYTTDEDVRLNTLMPNSPRDVNFISNYAGARPDLTSEYPTSVPYEGEKHWNIDRFAIDPQFSSSYGALENTQAYTDKTQQRRNTLADMYKYFMLQNKGNRDVAWKQANEFMTKEIDPRISGPMYDKLYGDESLSLLGGGITDFVDDKYVSNFNSLMNQVNLPENERSYQGKNFVKNPVSAQKAKDLAIDWLVNYKKMSPKQAETYYKKLPKKQNGGEMKYYQEGLDFRPKTISKNGSVIKDDRGQWAHPGEITEIGSNQITMQGVPYPVLGISDTGDTQMMYPNQDYIYEGSSVTEYPMMKEGGALQLIKLDQLTNFTNYNTKQPGGWLSKYE